MIKRYKILLEGVVQGVGLLQHIFKLAENYQLYGRVQLKGGAIEVDIEGDETPLDLFVQYIYTNKLPYAQLLNITVTDNEVIGYVNFKIKDSEHAHHHGFPLPDLGICDECMELLTNKDTLDDDGPFLHCYQCGPRYSIQVGFPYERKNTSYKHYPMCYSCSTQFLENNSTQYLDTISCINCGPQVKLMDYEGFGVKCEDVFVKANELLLDGYVLGIKDTGGFYLTCNAQYDEIVNVLRERKNRPSRPFAIMARYLEDIEEICYLSEEERILLMSKERPIVLLRKKTPFLLPDNIAPHTDYIGVKFPDSPISVLLFRYDLKYLILTKGANEGSPILYKDSTMLKALNNMAEYFLTHTLSIVNPIENSVVSWAGNPCIHKLAKGYSPTPLNMNIHKDYFPAQQILALGAKEHGNVCIGINGMGFISPYVGNLGDYNTYLSYRTLIDGYSKLLNANPSIIVSDLQERYPSSLYGKGLKGNKLFVQHHYAHLASCIGEHNIIEDVLGVIFDKGGLGTDGTLWGGEFLLGNLDGYERIGQFEEVTFTRQEPNLPEGLRYLASYFKEELIDGLEDEKNALYKLHYGSSRNLQCVTTSSIQLFLDGLAYWFGRLSGLSSEMANLLSIEAYATIETTQDYGYRLSKEERIYIHYEEILEGIRRDLRNSVPIKMVGTKVLNTLCNIVAEIASFVYRERNIKSIILSGDSFENAYLRRQMIAILKEKGFSVYVNEKIPCNDGGISFGQCVLAYRKLQKDILYEKENL